MMAACSLALLASTLTWNLHKSSEQRNYASLLPVEESPVHAISKKIQKAVAETVTEPAPVNASKPAEPAPVSATGKAVTTTHSYIVVGAFFDEGHAQKVKAQAESKGYMVHLSTDYNNSLFRVSVEVESPDVSATLARIKSEFNQRAWVYCTNCTLK
jgi:hypothetical protein